MPEAPASNVHALPQRPRKGADTSGIQKRGLSREQAAYYIGVSTTKFDEMVEDGRMPGPKLIDRRTVWDRVALDAAFEFLPDRKETNDWDD